MKRSSFLQYLVTTAGVFYGQSASSLENIPGIVKVDHPPYLKEGDLIGITSPAGFINMEELAPALERLGAWGFKYMVGKTIGKRDFTFGGTAEERITDLQRMLDDEHIKAILCARGGYGLVGIIDKLDFSKFAKHPKWIIGFSDVTVLHSHINKNYSVPTIHSKMCNSFPSDWQLADDMQKATIESIKLCLEGTIMKYTAPANPSNKPGRCRGELIGGNLKTLETLCGSKTDIDTKNKILFVEDANEYLYSIDRMFWNLERSGKLEKLKGLIVGGFRVKKDDEGEEFGRKLEEIVLSKIGDKNYPVCFDFPVGHQKNNFALKCGMMHELEINSSGSTLTEIR